MNEHLAAVREGDTNLNIEVDLTGFTLGAGLSDFVQEGRYALKIVDATVEPSKKGGSPNLKVSFVVEGPPGCSEKGKALVTYHPIPIGANGDAAELKRCFFLRALVAGIFDWAGKTGDAIKISHNLPQGWFKGKTVAAYVVEGLTKPSDATKEPQPVGELKSYITKEQFLVAPGPVGEKAQAKPAVGGQTSAPVVAQATKEAPATQAAPAQAQAQAAPAQAPAVQAPAAQVKDLLDF